MEKAKRRAARLGERPSRTFLSSLLASFLFSLLAAAGLLLLAALLLQRSGDPSHLLAPVGALLSAAVALLGGFRAGRLRRSSGALMGLCHGMLIAFVCLCTALVVRDGTLPLPSLLLYGGLLLTSTLGGAMSTRKKHRRRVHR